MLKYKLISLKYKLKKLPRKRVIFWSTFILLFLVSMGSIVRYYAIASFTGQQNSSVNISKKTVYVNDLQADWDYYESLNYTEVLQKNVLPSYSNRYNKDTLVAVQITYDGHDINNSSLVGFVSSSEQQHTFVYYKYYPIENSKVKIELIDNPYTMRPENKGFNGWVCKSINGGTCNGVTFSYDDDYYVRYLTVPQTMFRTDSDGNKTLVVNLNASWTNATVVNTYVSDSPDASYLKFKQMYVMPYNAVENQNCSKGNSRLLRTNMRIYEKRKAAQNAYYTGWEARGTYHDNTQCTTRGGCDYYILTTDVYYSSSKTYYIYPNTYTMTAVSSSNISTITTYCEPTLNYFLLNNYSTTGFFYKTTNSGNNDLFYDAKGVSCAISGNTCSTAKYKLIQSGETITERYSLKTDERYKNGDSSSCTTTIDKWKHCDIEVARRDSLGNYVYELAYDAEGNPIYKVQKDAYGNIIYEFEKDEFGNIVFEIEKDEFGEDKFEDDGTGNLSPVYALDDDGNKIPVYALDSDGNRIPVYILDGNGNRIQELKYDLNGNPIIVYDSKTVLVNKFENYHYLVTRDINIFDLSREINLSTINKSKPYTLTGNHASAANASAKIKPDASVTLIADIVIENVSYSSSLAKKSSSVNSEETGKSIYTSDYNFKIGRQVVVQNNYLFAYGVFGGQNNRVIVESGHFHWLRVLPTSSTSGYHNEAIYGSDYDRVSGKTNANSNLVVEYKALASNSGSHNSTTVKPTSQMIVKSGKFGNYILSHSASNVQTSVGSYYTFGIYTGSMSNGTSNSLRTLKVEGGRIFCINGGPSVASSSTNNYVMTHITGGEVDNVVGGAGTTTTSGNRIVSVTGGIINNAVAGGSNSYAGSSSNSPGPLNGSTIVYIGGTAVIGGTPAKKDNSGKLFDVSKTGSVFGAGLGLSGSSDRGVVNNSHVIINGGTIKGDVYGGGNFGQTGNGSTAASSTVEIKKGTINGSIYGGSNSNGFASTSSVSSSYLNVYVYGGVIKGSVYGGSNGSSTTNNCYVYTDNLNVTLSGGLINGSVYGGGYGKNTYVYRNVNVAINPSNNENLVINHSVYGGSAKGTVNSNGTGYNTKVTVDGGIIGYVYNTSTGVMSCASDDSDCVSGVFGAGEGDSSTAPVTNGNITVTIKNGIINNVYGGNNVNGTLGHVAYDASSGTKLGVIINGGTINKVFGGSNGQKAEAKNTYVKVTGGVIKNSLYGGGNKAKVSGTTKVLINGGNFYEKDAYGNYVSTASIFGGGQIANAGTSYVEIKANANNSKIYDVYGGGYQGNVTTSTVKFQNDNANNIYGGGYAAVVTTSTVNFVSGKANDVYGGGYQGTVTTSNVNIQNGKANNVYGGGYAAGVATSNVNLTGGEIYNAFGGSNQSGLVTTTNVKATGGKILENIYGGGNEAAVATSNLEINGTTFDTTASEFETVNDKGVLNVYLASKGNAFGGGNEADVTTKANVNFKGSTLVNLYGGSNSDGVVAETDVQVTGGTAANIFGGNNAGGHAERTYVHLASTTFSVQNVYGGGNGASETDDELAGVFKLSGANNDMNARSAVFAENGTINGDLYGGGNDSVVIGFTRISIKNAVIKGSVYGGGRSAFVGNQYTKEYVDSSGNFVENGLYRCDIAAAKGRSEPCGSGTPNGSRYIEAGSENSASTTINMSGGTVYGDIFGSGSYSFVHGNTTINLANTAIGGGAGTPSTKSITIYGDVYTGSYAATSAANLTDEDLNNLNYNYSTIGVEGNSYLELDGSGYTITLGNRGKGGSIYGDGSNSRVSNLALDPNLDISLTADTKSSYITIKNCGNITSGMHQTLASVSRSREVRIIDSVLELTGARNLADTDHKTRKNKYSFVDIYEMYLLGSSTGSNKGSTVYMNGGATMLRNFHSGYYTGTFDTVNFDHGDFQPETYNDTNKAVNVNNKIYLPDGVSLVISKDKYNPADTSGVGNVEGMAFIGVYSRLLLLASGKFDTGIYGMNYTIGRNVESDDNTITGYTFAYASAYELNSPERLKVINKNTENQATIEHGFFSNYFNDKCIEVVSGEKVLNESCVNADDDDRYTLRTTYTGLDPSNYSTDVYRWYIGDKVEELIVDLYATRYGVDSVNNLLINIDDIAKMNSPMMDIDRINTNNFLASSIGNSSLNYETHLVDYTEIPFVRTGVDGNGVPEANKYYALTMGTNTSGWLSNYSTSFYSADGISGNFCEPSLLASGSCRGVEKYYYDSQSTQALQRSLSFTLYYSNNIDTTLMINEDEEEVSLGYIMISTRVRDLDAADNSVASGGITVNIRVRVYISNSKADAYGYARAPGKKYEIFNNLPTKITNKSSFSVNQNLHLKMGDKVYKAETTEYWTVDKLYSSDSKHVLKSTVVFPSGTRISMLDLVDGKQYYLDLTDSNISGFIVSGGMEIPISNFVKMSNVSGTLEYYNDSPSTNMSRYYIDSGGIETVDESFIFIVDFFNSNSPDFNCSDGTLYMDLMHGSNTSSDKYLITAESPKTYTVYGIDDLTLATEGGFVVGGSTVSSTDIYLDETTVVELSSDVFSSGGLPADVTNTIYDDYQLGAIISFKNSDGSTLTYQNLEGLVVNVNGVNYSPENSESGGVIRINLAGRITSVISNVTLDFSNVTSDMMSVGNYKLVIETFGSYDGLYYGGSSVKAENLELSFRLLSNAFGLNANVEPVSITHDVYTGKDNDGRKEIYYTIKSKNGLASPHLLISMDRLLANGLNLDYAQGNICGFADKIELYSEDLATKHSEIDCSASPTTVSITNGVSGASYYDLGAISNTYDNETIYKVKVTLKDGSNSGSALWNSGTYRIMFTVTDEGTGVKRYIGSAYEYLIIRHLGVNEYNEGR